MEKKFELTDKFVINAFGIGLFQIKCTKSFKYANEGDLGGYVEKEDNLSQYGDAWVSGDAQVYGDAQVSGDAWVSGDAQVYGDARVSGDAWVSGDAQVYGDARVYGKAWVSGDAQVYGKAWVSGDAQVYGDAQVSGDAWVSGDAQVSGDARVENNHMHCGFDCFGSCNRHTHAYKTKGNKVEITCGCFRGSLEEFEKKVEETHKGTIYEKQYKAIINLIKIKFGIDG
ncbi:polymer-forming cytoskeletal protein [Paraprevotella xylaniphila]|uniref:polymer-forming cytoskeletal protein n=1 Tax=Paraprevotella xylaniphila TaxID=454155 RepID=UPI001032F014|nr:polymer-forming cytoskeletal protein [Paraprevotella xylaniphila]